MASRAGATVDGHHSSKNYEQWGDDDDGQDCESHDDDNSEVLAEDKRKYMKANANRVPMGPSDCNRGMYVWPSTVGPKPNERRSKERAAQKLCKRPQGSGPGDRGQEVSVGARVPGPQGFVRFVGETHVKCQLAHEAEP